MPRNTSAGLLCGVLFLLASALVSAQSAPTPPMLQGNGWKATAAFTVSDSIGAYTPTGILDGLGAWGLGQNRALILVNHELNPSVGYAYSLANGTQLTGARVSAMVIQRANGCFSVENAGPAFDTIYDRAGQVVVDPAQVNETGNAIDGFARFCSAQGVRAGDYGFVDDLFFTGEETSKPFHPHGGTEWVVDVHGRAIWAAPALGRGAWENVTAISTGNIGTVGLLLGDDTASAPLYLYIGQKNALGNGSFLDRNGLAVGQLYVWKADNGDLDPQAFNGANSTRSGSFVPVAVRNPAMAGMAGHDAMGYLDGDTLRAAADALGAFSFSRPEDLHTNPANGTQVVFASTGRGSLFPADNWGTIYRIDLNFGTPGSILASLEILHDADGLAVPDEGIRSPDNLTWAKNGMIYVQEDRSTSPSSLFGAVSGREASIWELDPTSRNYHPIASVDRSVIRPIGATDIGAGSIGHWETSGVIDVSDLFATKNGEQLLLATVQAHGLRDGLIGGNANLGEGGQICFLSKKHSMLATDTPSTSAGFDAEPIFTVSESFAGYQPAGILDGLGAFPAGQNRAMVLVNHELNPGNGYAYTLANGTQLNGARISAMLVERTNCGGKVLDARMAYDTMYDRLGVVVTDPAQVNETGNGIDGLARFCSARSVQAGTYGFVDDLFFSGEETSKPFHPHGGSEWVLDVQGRTLWAAPALGRGAWENLSPVETGNPNTIGLILGDDVESAPLYLYIGQKDALGNGSFLDRNGLAVGQLYVWKADNGDLDPQAFNGAGSVRAGSFVPVAIRNPAMAGMTGYDGEGYLDGDTLRASADALGAFSFSRPEDLHDNPADGTQVAFASTGRGGLFPADNWGTVYMLDLDFSQMPNIPASLVILHDADGLAVPDTGIRSPDNLTWASDGMIYVQEDRSTSPSSLFGAATGIEASIWQLNPATGTTRRIAHVDRDVVLPEGSTDIGAGTIGHWETSGIIDLAGVLPGAPGETLLLATVQAHGIRDGLIGDNPLLDEGGQLVFLRKKGLSHSISCTDINPSQLDLRVRVENGSAGNSYFTAFAIQNPGWAPNGPFYGINISFNELLSQLTPPFMGTLNADGRAGYNFVLGGQCPLGITLDCVAIEYNAGGIVQWSQAATIQL